MAHRGIPIAVLLAALASSPAKAGEPPVLRDSAGEVVGTVIGKASDAEAAMGIVEETLVWVAHPMPGVPVRLLVGENGPWDTKGVEPLLYESDDCSGVPLVDTPAEADQVRPAVIFGTEVFWGESAGAPRVIRSRATLVRDPDDCAADSVAPQVCCTAVESGETRTVAPVTGAALTSFRLQPPFRLDESR